MAAALPGTRPHICGAGAWLCSCCSQAEIAVSASNVVQALRCTAREVLAGTGEAAASGTKVGSCRRVTCMGCVEHRLQWKLNCVVLLAKAGCACCPTRAYNAPRLAWSYFWASSAGSGMACVGCCCVRHTECVACVGCRCTRHTRVPRATQIVLSVSDSTASLSPG